MVKGWAPAGKTSENLGGYMEIWRHENSQNGGIEEPEAMNGHLYLVCLRTQARLAFSPGFLRQSHLLLNSVLPFDRV